LPEAGPQKTEICEYKWIRWNEEDMAAEMSRESGRGGVFDAAQVWRTDSC